MVLCVALAKYVRRLFFRHIAGLDYANQQLSALNQISEEFRQLRSESDLFDQIPKKLSEALDFDRSIFWLVQDRVASARSHYWTEDEALFKKILDDIEKLKKGIADGNQAAPKVLLEFIESRKTRIYEDVKKDFHWTEALTKDTKSIIMIPVNVHNVMLGFISANLQYHERDMDRQDIDKLETFANMVSVTIENLRHFNQLEELVGSGSGAETR